MHLKAIKCRGCAACRLCEIAVGVISSQRRPVVVGAEVNILVAAGFERIVN